VLSGIANLSVYMVGSGVATIPRMQCLGWKQMPHTGPATCSTQTSSANASARRVGFLLRGDGKSPANWPLSRRVPGVVLRRKRFEGLGNDFASAPMASIDARMGGRFSGRILLVELRTEADFYVVAAPKDRHGSPSFACKPQPSEPEGWRGFMASQRRGPW